MRLAATNYEAAKKDLVRQTADLDRFRREVPIQIEIARRALAVALTDRSKAEVGLTLTEDDVEKGIDEARAELKATRADLLLAQQDHHRFTNLAQHGTSTQRELDQSTRSRDASEAHVDLAQARLAKAIAARHQIDVSRHALEAARTGADKATRSVELAETQNDQIHVVELAVEVKKETVEEARRALESAEDELAYTQIRAPSSGVVVKRFRHLGDFASVGSPILSMYNPDLLYVTANLEETRLPGVKPGNPVRLEIDAFPEPFRGHVLWLNKSTGAQFALMPRNVVSGEFTKVVQRIPVRIGIERDQRWPLLRAGLSVRAMIGHEPGDLAWAQTEARRLSELETRSSDDTGSGMAPLSAAPKMRTSVEVPADSQGGARKR